MCLFFKAGCNTAWHCSIYLHGQQKRRRQLTITKPTLIVQSVSTAYWSTLLFRCFMHAWYDEMLEDVYWTASATSRSSLIWPFRCELAFSLRLIQSKPVLKPGALSYNSGQQASIAFRISRRDHMSDRFARNSNSSFGSVNRNG